MSQKTRLTIQYILCIVLVLCGLFLLFFGFTVEPIGEIHNSMLIAFGEIATFAGSLIGIDYSYQIRVLKHKGDKDEKDRN
mgnify:FL=1